MDVKQYVQITISREEARELLDSTAPAPVAGTALYVFRLFLQGLVGE